MGTSVATTATGNTAEQVYLGASVQPGSYRMIATSLRQVVYIVNLV